MIFSELYSAYYNAVARILASATEHPLKKGDIYKIVENNAFGESILNIEPAITEERWQLILPDGTTPIKNYPTMPMTTLQKRWLKSIYADPRMRLFTDDAPDFPDVEPLFTADDICVFDKYCDGDNFTDEKYIKNFRLILDAIKNRYPIKMDTLNGKGEPIYRIIMPERLEYSEKDDKFRLIGYSDRYGSTVNLGRIIKCRPYLKPFSTGNKTCSDVEKRQVTFELVNYRNALERVLLHFAHFEKQAEKIDDSHYRVTVNYDKDDETEIVIRILSFGPMIKVTAPQHFVELIKERLIKQKSCEH